MNRSDVLEITVPGLSWKSNPINYLSADRVLEIARGVAVVSVESDERLLSRVVEEARRAGFMANTVKLSYVAQEVNKILAGG